MSDTQISRHPIQVFLDTKQFIADQKAKPRGGNKDFFEDNDAGFARHKIKMQKRIQDTVGELRQEQQPAGFVVVQMSEMALAKSYIRFLITGFIILCLGHLFRACWEGVNPFIGSLRRYDCTATDFQGFQFPFADFLIGLCPANRESFTKALQVIGSALMILHVYLLSPGLLAA